MSARLVAEAIGLFAMTNFDDIVILALFFGRGAGERGSARRIVAGQHLAFSAILAIAIALSYGASFLPKQAIAHLGLLPIGIGLWEAWKMCKNRSGDNGQQTDGTSACGVPRGLFFATRPVIAEALARWGHIVLPVVLIAIGLVILIEGGAFGL